MPEEHPTGLYTVESRSPVGGGGGRPVGIRTWGEEGHSRGWAPQRGGSEPKLGRKGTLAWARWYEVSEPEQNTDGAYGGETWQ